MIGKPFEKGSPGGPGRPKGSRNRLTESFVRDLQTEWERSGPAVLKILAVEAPGDFAKLCATLVPKAFDELPVSVTVYTGVPCNDDESPAAVTVPRLPTTQIPLTPSEPSVVPSKDDEPY